MNYQNSGGNYHRRIGYDIQNEFVLPVDEYYYQENTTPESGNAELGSQPVPPVSQQKEGSGQYFNEKYPDRNAGSAIAAATAQEEIAEYRNIVQ